jgi:hypothetical protein
MEVNRYLRRGRETKKATADKIQEETHNKWILITEKRRDNYLRLQNNNCQDNIHLFFINNVCNRYQTAEFRGVPIINVHYLVTSNMTGHEAHY